MPRRRFSSEMERISAVEYAMLSLTNQQNPARDKRAVRPLSNHSRSRSKAIVLTTKEAYLWAAFLALAVERKPDVDAETLTSRLQTALREFQMTEGVIERLGGDAPNVQSRFEVFSYASRALEFEVNFNELAVITNRGYTGLLDAQLIEDPPVLTVGVLSLAVLGLLPYSFTRQTAKGRTLLLKFDSMFMSYERSTKQGITTTDVKFRLWRVMRAFYRFAASGFAGAVQELSRGEPEEKGGSNENS